MLLCAAKKWCGAERLCNTFCNFAPAMKITRKRYLQGFGVAVILLAMVRCAHPQVAGCYNPHDGMAALSQAHVVATAYTKSDSLMMVGGIGDLNEVVPASNHARSRFFNADGTLVKNRIYSVPNFGDAFPDQNDVQLLAANRHGVKAVVDRADAERRKSELVYVGSSPFYHVDHLKSSIPYLVPRAAVLLQDIGSAFFDSLQTKQIPLHKIIVTSVLRSKADVTKLRSHNGNATENSCHLYGTTFDICYNRYCTIEDPDGPSRRKVRNDSLKWVLSEVLDDMRKNQRCLIKYEVKQGCFHITVN